MSAIPPGLETLAYTFNGTQPVGHFAAVLVGVVGSGNLEIMAEAAPGNTCSVQVSTSARGFAPIWDAVVRDFHLRHALAGVQIAINDMGATPAVVSLRLDQAVAELKGQATEKGNAA